MALIIIRTIILYFVTLLAIKAMGKRQIAELQPFELAIVLIISDMATLAMQSNTMPIVKSVLPIVTITLLQLILSLSALKSWAVRRFVCGRPDFVIQNGKVNESVLRRLRINLNDLQELTRSQGYFDLSAINYAIMETNGALSILPKTEKRPLEVADLLEKPPREVFPCLLVLDGKVNEKALQAAGRNQRWLDKQLHGDDVDHCFIAGLDDSGNFFYQLKEDAQK